MINIKLIYINKNFCNYLCEIILLHHIIRPNNLSYELLITNTFEKIIKHFIYKVINDSTHNFFVSVFRPIIKLLNYQRIDP